MKQLTLIFIILLLPGVMFAAQGLEIFTPPPFLSTTNGSINVVGRTSAPLVEIYLNGQRLQTVQVKDSIFHVEVSFNYGLNEIQLSPVYSGKIETTAFAQQIEILCGPDVTGRYERLYPKHLFHSARPQEICIKCHDPALDGPLPSQGNDACLSCHTSFMIDEPDLNKSRHTNCDACHKLGADLLSLTSSVGYFEESTCFNCHEDKRHKFGQEYIHGPVAVGSCTVCHDPHGSRHEHSLVTAEEILCFACHDFQLELREMRVQHKPFDRGQCGVCHDPHATGNKWVLVKTSETVCLTCHLNEEGSMDFHTHPFNVEPKYALRNNLKLSQSGRLECLSCHNPHASQAEHLLRTNESFTCSGCHADKTD